VDRRPNLQMFEILFLKVQNLHLALIDLGEFNSPLEKDASLIDLAFQMSYSCSFKISKSSRN